MSPENRIGELPFRVEVRPTGEINHRAVLQERVYLFDGRQYAVSLGERITRARSFVDIRRHYFPDGNMIYHPFAHWGLKDAGTGEDIRGYTDASIAVDPIHIFRIAKILEALPRLSDDSRQYIDDYCSAATAAARTFYAWDFEEPGKQEMLGRRHGVISLIGRSKWREIVRMIPPHLEEMMQTLQEKGIVVMTETLERELRLKRLVPSEFYSSMISAYHKAVEDMARDLEETGGRW